MRKEFLIKVGEPSQYNYICGRIKVLESFLLSSGDIERITLGDIKDVKTVLMDTPYKNFIKGDRFSDISAAIFRRFNAELTDIEKYVSQGFINAFFRNKELFLKLKKWALLGEMQNESKLYEDLYRFVNGGSGDFPILFREAYLRMLSFKDNPLSVGAVLDIYRIKYLTKSAEQTSSDLILRYYRSYGESSVENILFRLKNFSESGIIDDKSLVSMLQLMAEMLPDYKLSKEASEAKDVEEFKNFVNARISEEDFIRSNKKLFTILESGRYFNSGIEVVFVYLKHLQLEVSTISMILNGKITGMKNEDISERVSLRL